MTLLEGNTEASVALLKTAVARYDALDMSLRAAAAAYRLGEVVGGNEGRAIRAASTSRMRMLGVTDPAAIARGFMPSVL